MNIYVLRRIQYIQMSRISSLDEQIKELERQLEYGGDEDSSNGVSDNDCSVNDSEEEEQLFVDNNVNERILCNDVVVEKDKFGNDVRMYSNLKSKLHSDHLYMLYFAHLFCN